VTARALLEELNADPAARAELRVLLGGRVAYTTETLATELDVTPRAIRAAIERGDLEARRSGRGYVIGAEAVAAWARAPSNVRRRGAWRESRPLRNAMADLDEC
jgi:excisionase family DNA binding protein